MKRVQVDFHACEIVHGVTIGGGTDETVVRYTTTSTGLEGNAIIAVYDGENATGNIL